MEDKTAFGPELEGLDNADGKGGVGRGTCQVRQDIGNIAFCRHGQAQKRSGGDLVGYLFTMLSAQST